MSDEKDSLLDGDLSPEDYAELWGSDASFDHPPLVKGDGAYFYNFRDRQGDVLFLARFAEIIDRQIERVKLLATSAQENPDTDVAELSYLKVVVLRKYMELTPAGKCARTACQKEGAVCLHLLDNRWYCVKCARRINEYATNCPRCDGFTPSDHRLVFIPPPQFQRPA